MRFEVGWIYFVSFWEGFYEWKECMIWCWVYKGVGFVFFIVVCVGKVYYCGDLVLVLNFKF